MKVKNYHMDDNGNMPDEEWSREVQKALNADPDYRKWLDKLEKENERLDSDPR